MLKLIAEDSVIENEEIIILQVREEIIQGSSVQISYRLCNLSYALT